MRPTTLKINLPCQTEGGESGLLTSVVYRGAETGQNTGQLELGLVQNRNLQERGGCVFPLVWSGVRTDTE